MASPSLPVFMPPMKKPATVATPMSVRAMIATRTPRVRGMSHQMAIPTGSRWRRTARESRPPVS